MSRGRQKRVEANEKRRQESRKKKVQKEIRSLYKALVQNQLFPLLDQLSFNLEVSDVSEDSEDSDSNAEVKITPKPNERLSLHVWVDTLPSSAARNMKLNSTCTRTHAKDRDHAHDHAHTHAGADDYHDDQSSSKKNKKNKSKGRGGSGNKKSHPRSTGDDTGGGGGADGGDGEDCMEDESLLCHRYFFTGACPGFKNQKGKKNGLSCQHDHYLYSASSSLNSHSNSHSHSNSNSLKPPVSLADAIMANSKKKNGTKSCGDGSGSGSVMTSTPTTCIHVDEQSRASYTAEALKRASMAAAMAQMKLDDTVLDIDKVDGIDKLHHIEIPLISSLNGKESKVRYKTVPELVSKTMVSEKVPISGIAYVVYCNILVFDRFDGGVLALEEDIRLKLFGTNNEGNEATDAQASSSSSSRDDKNSSITTSACNGNDGGTNDECGEDGIHIIQCTGPVLELILSYLPDKYSGLVPSVCRTFHREIGTHSPALWKDLSDRHDWPIIITADRTSSTPGTEQKDPTAIHKDSFVNYFRACHRAEALNKGICKVLQADTGHSCIGTCTGNPGVVVKFDRGSGASSKYYGGVHFWDDAHILVTSKEDCLLRLFKVSESESSTHLCKQVLEIRIAPVPVTKKISCSMLSIAADDRYILLAYVVDGNCVVASMMKDHLLTNYMEDSILSGSILRCHDLTRSFCDFREINMGLEQYAYLYHALPMINNDNDMEDALSVLLVDDVHVCGNGVFCAIVEIRYIENDDELAEFPPLVLFTGILTFWGGNAETDSVVLDFLRLPETIITNNSALCTSYQTKKRSEPAEIMLQTLGLADLFSIVVDRHGKFQSIRHLYQDWDLSDSWDLFEDALSVDVRSQLKILNCRSLAVSSYMLSLSSNRERNYKHVAITFQQTGQSDEESSPPPSTMMLRNPYSSILSMKLMNEDYLMMMCECYNHTDREVGTLGHTNDEVDKESKKLFDLVIIHIPKMSEIHCSTVWSSQSTDDEVRILLDISKKGAMAAVVGDIGLCITRLDLMNMATYPEEHKLRKIKKVRKKKRLVAKTGNGGKKQGTGLVKL